MSAPVMAITGSSGFIGTALARAAAARGFVVRGLDLLPPDSDCGWQTRIGSVTSARDAAALCEGAHIVVHTAAVVREDGDDDLFESVNVQGTRNLAHAAAEQGVEHFIHLSSVMVYGFDYPLRVDEDGPLGGFDNPYCRSKIRAERVLRHLHNAGALPVTILRPGDVYGPGSVPWVQRPLQLMARRLFALPAASPGLLNPVWIDNLVDAILLCVAHGPRGGLWNVTDGFAISCRQYFERLGALIDRRPTTLPEPALRLGFRTLNRVCRSAGRIPPASPTAIRFLTRPHPYCSERIRRDLGHQPRVSVNDAFTRLDTWVRENPHILEAPLFPRDPSHGH